MPAWGTFDPANGSKLCNGDNVKTKPPMEKTLGLGLWAVVTLYAALGVFGVVFHNSLPDPQQLTDGYGISFVTTAALRTTTTK